MNSSNSKWQYLSIAGAFAAGVTAGHLFHTYIKNHNSIQTIPSLPPTALLAAVELGGTSCRAAIAYTDNPTQFTDSVEIPTTDPQTTLSELLRFLRSHFPFAALGIASFGPLDLDRSSSTYGFITTTPKPGWQNINLLSFFSQFNVPIGFDTDVNAPALAELRYGSHGNGDSCAYITVGTGIGVGLVVNGRPVHGLVHPEGGHIMPLQKDGDTYKGWSSLHTQAVESMASAKACAQRAGVPTTQLATVPDEDSIWDDVAYYLAQLCLTICYIASPHVIVLSGGVMKRTILFDKIRETFLRLNEGYIAADKIQNHLDDYIVSSAYGNQIGIIGAIELARRAAIGLE